jgi:NTE family protein
MDDTTPITQSGIPAPRRASALIVAGAADKGPFAAGALAELATDSRFDVRYLAGASSGALNAAVYAAGLRAGEPREAAELLVDLWREQATLPRILKFEDRVSIAQQAIERFRADQRVHEVALDVTLSSLRGTKDTFGHRRFEQTLSFVTEDFEDDRGIRRIAEACVISSAIPVIFAPREIGDSGPFWDGGIVNNAPIGRALRYDRAIDHLIVITPDSNHVDPDQRFWRFSIRRLVDLLIDERLGRDLYEAKSFNEELRTKDDRGVTLAEHGRELGWRLLEFLEIRPERDLGGWLGAGFVSERRRSAYIEAGKSAAERALRELSSRASRAAARAAV